MSNTKTTHRQAIVTRYLPCTDTKPSRVKATCDAGTVTVPWDDALNNPDNHAAACAALCRKIDTASAKRYGKEAATGKAAWSHTRYVGGTSDAIRGYVFVAIDEV